MTSDDRDLPHASDARVTDAELAVLRRLWKRGPATIRELMVELYPDGGTSAYATVQKLLDRLEAKGCVSRRSGASRGGATRANVFSPEVSRGEVVHRRLQEIADAFFDGALSPLVTHLVSSPELDRADLEKLRRLVAELDAGSAE